MLFTTFKTQFLAIAMLGFLSACSQAYDVVRDPQAVLQTEAPPKVCTNGATNHPDCDSCIAPNLLIDGTCGQCAANEVYNSSSQTCEPGVCANGGSNFPVCGCAVGEVLIQGTCGTCASDEVYNTSSESCEPGICSNGASNYPACTNCPADKVYNAATKACDPGICSNGASNYPACTNCPADKVYNAVTKACDPGICSNGASNYPACSNCPADKVYNAVTQACDPGICSNGASNYPACDNCPADKVYNAVTKACDPGICLNGASNYPTCLEVGTFMFTEKYDWDKTCDTRIIYECNIKTSIAVGFSTPAACSFRSSEVAANFNCFPYALRVTLKSSPGPEITIERQDTNLYKIKVKLSEGTESSVTVDTLDALDIKKLEEGILEL